RARAAQGRRRGARLGRFRLAVVGAGGAAGARDARRRADSHARRRGAGPARRALTRVLSRIVRDWTVLDLGTEGFRDTWARQLALVERRQRGEVGDTLIVVEHPHVFTLGRRRDAEANVLMPGDVEV